MDSLHLLEHQLLDSLIWLDDNSDVLVSAAKVLKNGKNIFLRCHIGTFLFLSHTLS